MKHNNRDFSHYLVYQSSTGRHIKTIPCDKNTCIIEASKRLKKYHAQRVYKSSCKWWEDETGLKTHEEFPKRDD